MASPDSEISRLHDLMPASGRMWIRIVPQPGLGCAIASPFPYPWQRQRQLQINFDLWRRLPRPQRDLLALRQCAWVMGVRWFAPNWYQAAVALGSVTVLVELGQADALGALVAGGLTGVAGAQIWRLNRRPEREIEADQDAIAIAQRRGYGQREATEQLLAAIEAAAALAGRPLDFEELLRCQRLRSRLGGVVSPHPPVR
ncbi:MAG: DUF3318 domain-containing protein [Cyanobacteria bacterium]|nr:DUF3318 domain-containing protein [Cyanobacteriota bacterium]